MQRALWRPLVAAVCWIPKPERTSTKANGVGNHEIPRRGEVFLIDLDPTRGTEIQKTRPCVVVSPDDLNAHLRTVIVAPMTTAAHRYPFRVQCRFSGKNGQVVIDQLRTVDRERLVRHLGRLSAATINHLLDVLQEMFAP